MPPYMLPHYNLAQGVTWCCSQWLISLQTPIAQQPGPLRCCHVPAQSEVIWDACCRGPPRPYPTSSHASPSAGPVPGQGYDPASIWAAAQQQSSTAAGGSMQGGAAQMGGTHRMGGGHQLGSQAQQQLQQQQLQQQQARQQEQEQQRQREQRKAEAQQRASTEADMQVRGLGFRVHRVLQQAGTNQALCAQGTTRLAIRLGRGMGESGCVW